MNTCEALQTLQVLLRPLRAAVYTCVVSKPKLETRIEN